MTSPAASQDVTLLAWNILHGGGPERTPQIGLEIVERAPDVVLLCEFRAGRGGQLRAQLADAGLTHQLATDVHPARNGLLLASRYPIAAADTPEFGVPGRMLAANLFGLLLMGVHIPDDGALPQKAAFFQQLTTLARKNRENPCVILGDFNTSRRGQDTDARAFRLEHQLGLLETYGFVDAWRAKNPGKREDSWVSAIGRGRLDSAYLSAPLADALLIAHYDHAPREAGLSDHSMLLLRLRLKVAAPLSEPRQGLFGRAAH